MGLKGFFRRGKRRAGPPAGAQSTRSETSEGEGDDLRARAADLSHLLGQARLDEQRIAAVERLTELRAAGEVSEENFLRERRRLLGER